MHVKFNFFKGVTKRPPSFMKSGCWRDLQSHSIQLKVYLTLPCNISSKYGVVSILVNPITEILLLITQSKANRDWKMSRLRTSCLLSKDKRNYSSHQKRQHEFAFWDWMHHSKDLFKSSNFFNGPRFIFKKSKGFCILLQNASLFVITCVLSFSGRGWLPLNF